MNESTRAAERFRRSMAAAAAKPSRAPRPPRVAAKPIPAPRPARVVPLPSCAVCDTPILLDRCDACGGHIPPGQHVLSFADCFQVLCYACKDIVDDDEDWDE